jgi:2-methylisocitrate lyase-like PEP mutase family enzyme/2-polyprenyl-6-methoxyphenol hydroxylase-like FAD-dependent oxidoreductase
MSTMSIPATPTSHSSVIVAGMGPAGMVAALALAQQGVDVTVLEAGPTLAEESRASTFHPSSLEILDALGVGAELHTRGLIAPNFQYRDRAGAILADLDLAVLAEDTAFPYRLQSEQNNLTEIILSRLEGMSNVRLVFNAPVERVELATNSARVFLPSDGRDPSFTADWLIAADGAKSNTRKSLGIAFEGMTIAERFLVASTTHEFANVIENLANVSYVSDPDDWGVLLRTPRHWRVLMPVAVGVSDEAATDPAVVEERLQKISPKDGTYPLEHITIYSVQQRVAATLATGRVLLVGDSAHVNNPLGGMGMNSGIHDARAAADAILAALSGSDPALCAAAYDDARRDAANSHVQKSSKENYREMSESDAAARHRRTESLAAMTADADKLRTYLLKASMLTSLAISNERLRAGLRAARRNTIPAGRRLAALLAAGPVLAPGAHDAISARMLSEAGFTVGFISGAGVAATALGTPDLGYVGQQEMTEQIWRLAGASSVPFIADGDGGYGGPLQVARTVSTYERAGAAAITLEDQRLPKRCGHLAGKEILPTADMVAKIRAAVEARGEMLVIGRTDALALEGFDATLARAVAYAAAGADLIYVEGELSASQLTTLHRATGRKLVLNRSEASTAPASALLDETALIAAGVGVVIYPVSGLLAASQAVRSTYEAIAKTSIPDASILLPWPELGEVLDLPGLMRADESYAITA